MKRCPVCTKTFSEGFSFCTEDGTPLVEIDPTVPVPKPASTPRSEAPITREPVASVARSRRDRGRMFSRESVRSEDDRTKRLRALIIGFVAVSIVLMLLVALAVSGGWGSHSEPPTSQQSEPGGGGGLTNTGFNEPPVVFNAETDLKVAEFFDRWKTTGEASDETWVEIAEIAAKVSTQMPTNSQAHARHEYAQGQVEQRRGRIDEADSWYAASSVSWPGWALPINGRGKLAAQRRDFAEAIRHYRDAIEADPAWLFPRTNLIGTYLTLGNYTEVEAEARRTLSRHPNSAYAHYGLAMALGREGRYADAIAEGEAALGIDRNGATGFDAVGLRQILSNWRRSSTEPPVNQGGFPKQMTVEAPDDGFLSLRSIPSRSTGDRIGRIPHRTTIILIRCESRVLRIEGEFGHWCLTRFGGRTGWVFDGFLR